MAYHANSPKLLSVGDSYYSTDDSYTIILQLQFLEILVYNILYYIAQYDNCNTYELYGFLYNVFGSILQFISIGWNMYTLQFI